MEVLPILENVFIEFQPSGPVHKVMKGFVAARQLAGHPVTISHLPIKKKKEYDYVQYKEATRS